MQCNFKSTCNIMLIAGTLGIACLAHAENLIAQEEFVYGSTPNLYGANGGIGWSSQWYKLSSIPTGVTQESLTWPGLVTSGGSAYTAPYATADFTRYSRAITPYTDPNNTVYLSFLVRPNPGYGVNGGLAFGTWDNGMVVGTRPTSVYGLMTPPNTANSDSSTPVVQGETALLVTRVHLNADATVTWSLFVNPKVGGPELVNPQAVLTIPGTMLPPALMIYNDGGFSTDEIRLGHTWASVLPAIAPIGDVTGNGVVDIDDLLAVINAWGVCPAPCPADVNGDGAVNIDDLLTVINHWS